MHHSAHANLLPSKNRASLIRSNSLVSGGPRERIYYKDADVADILGTPGSGSGGGGAAASGGGARLSASSTAAGGGGGKEEVRTEVLQVLEVVSQSLQAFFFVRSARVFEHVHTLAERLVPLNVSAGEVSFVGAARALRRRRCVSPRSAPNPH